ncbi:MAG TPA: hypothetical protein DDY91_05440 [Planctomycetaceae bacterium]|nr:hypothetical protein [Planctomycetaceae bacterium]
MLLFRTCHFTHTTTLHELWPIARTEKPNLQIRKTDIDWEGSLVLPPVEGRFQIAVRNLALGQ